MNVSERAKILFTFIIGLVSGIVIGYLLAFFHVLDFFSTVKFDASIIAFLIVDSPKKDFFSDLMTLEAGLIGVAIPITLTVVTMTADRYRDPEIAQFFTKESLYRFQYISLLLSIIVIILLEFLGITYFLFLWFVFFWFIANMYVFFTFIRLVEQYVTNTDKILRRKLKEYVENILKD